MSTKTRSCCCACEEPAHRRSEHGERCARCGNHRAPQGRIRWVDDDWTPEPHSEGPEWRAGDCECEDSLNCPVHHPLAWLSEYHRLTRSAFHSADDRARFDTALATLRLPQHPEPSEGGVGYVVLVRYAAGTMAGEPRCINGWFIESEEVESRDDALNTMLYAQDECPQHQYVVARVVPLTEEAP